MRRDTFLAALGAGFLAACGTPAPRGTPGPGAIPSSGSAAPTLASEQRRLAYLFRGTPVVITLVNDSTMRVEVPGVHCFDPRRAKVRPALAAVLDRLASSPRAGPARWVVAASGDAPGASTLASERTAAVKDYVVARGVSAARLQSTPGTVADGVVLVVSE